MAKTGRPPAKNPKRNRFTMRITDNELAFINQAATDLHMSKRDALLFLSAIGLRDLILSKFRKDNSDGKI